MWCKWNEHTRDTLIQLCVCFPSPRLSALIPLWSVGMLLCVRSLARPEGLVYDNTGESFTCHLGEKFHWTHMCVDQTNSNKHHWRINWGKELSLAYVVVRKCLKYFQKLKIHTAIRRTWGNIPVWSRRGFCPAGGLHAVNLSYPRRAAALTFLHCNAWLHNKLPPADGQDTKRALKKVRVSLAKHWWDKISVHFSLFENSAECPLMHLPQGMWLSTFLNGCLVCNSHHLPCT